MLLLTATSFVINDSKSVGLRPIIQFSNWVFAETANSPNWKVNLRKIMSFIISTGKRMGKFKKVRKNVGRSLDNVDNKLTCQVW